MISQGNCTSLIPMLIPMVLVAAVIVTSRWFILPVIVILILGIMPTNALDVIGQANHASNEMMVQNGMLPDCPIATITAASLVAAFVLTVLARLSGSKIAIRLTFIAVMFSLASDSTYEYASRNGIEADGMALAAIGLIASCSVLLVPLSSHKD